MYGNGREIAPLTSLRFLAASLVFLEHVIMLPGVEWAEVGNGCLGKIGVSIFFVLSGFILTHAYGTQDWNGAFGKNAGGFYWHRFARIYPLHWLMFLVALPLGLHSNTARVSVSDFPYLLTLTERMWPWVTHGPQPVKVAWTLSVEFLFYLSAPVLFLILSKTRKPLRLLGILIPLYSIGIAWLVLKHPHLNWEAFTRVPDFLVGMAGYHLARKIDFSPYAIGLLCLGVVVFVVAGIGDATHEWPLRTFAYIPASLATILAFGNLGGAMQTVFSKPLFLLLGNASFALYLLHDPLLRYAKVLFNRSSIVFSLPASIFVGIGFYLLATMAAILCYKLYETPCRLWLRQWFDSGRKNESRLSTPAPTK